MKLQYLLTFHTNLFVLFAFFSPLIKCGYIYYLLGAICTEYSIPVNITAALYNFNASEWTGNNELTQFVIGNVGRGPKGPSPLNGPQNETAQYTISAPFCTPQHKDAAHAKTVILASHGFGFDRLSALS
jgi:hypothetical protein